MGKKVIAFITSLALIPSGLQFNWKVEEVAAAQFAGTHFAMEFSGYDSANMEKAHGWSNGGMFNCTWLDSNVNFSDDGIMSLTINSNGSGGYTGGEYRTREYFGYGMYQVNMKPIKNPGVVTSFFTYTGPTDGTIWDEIDIEFLGYDTTKVQFNYFSNGVGNHEYIHNLGFDASESFHTYGFYWGPGTITWYVDGVAVYTVNSSDVPVTPGKIMMNVWPGTGVDSWLQPYNGVTPLTGYYDWAVYDAPGSGEQTTTQAITEATTTTAAAQDGYVAAGPEWNNLDYWSVYFASGWANNPTGSYKAGSSYNDFSVKINSASATDWGIQMKTGQLSVDEGSKYKAIVKANANMSSVNQIRYKDEGSQTEKLYTINEGANTFELEFTAAGFAQIFFDLGQAPAGLQFDITSFSLEKIEEATVAPTESATTEVQVTTQSPEIHTTQAADGSYDSLNFQTIECTGTAGLTLDYAITSSDVPGLVPWYGDGGNTLSLQFSADAGNVSSITVNGEEPSSGVVTETTLGLVKINPNILEDNAYSEIKVVTEGGEFTIIVKRGTPGAETQTTEAPTTEEETTFVNRIENGIEVNGYQISATAKGMRTLYSVDSEIDGKDVVSSGLVYSLADYATEKDLYVGSESEYVKHFESTEVGKADVVFSDSDIATSYAMTMKFATTEAAEYKAGWRVCAYAKLSDGTYVYTKPYTYTIYQVSDELYQNGGMSTKEHHDYLYTDILSIVNKDYAIKEFDWNDSIMGA